MIRKWIAALRRRVSAAKGAVREAQYLYLKASDIAPGMIFVANLD